MTTQITRDNKEPAIGIIGGSGLYEMEALEQIHNHSFDTPYGTPSDSIIEGRLAGRRVCFLPRHGIGHRLLAHEVNHRANVWAMRSLNVRWLVSVTAVGSLRDHLAPRDIVIPDQLIDRTGKASTHTFFGNGIVAHIGFSDPYSENMRELLVNAARTHTPKTHNSATYISMNGPAFSTRAEANMHRAIGADIIGMTNGPEARLAREAEIAAATLALVTDFDCWKPDEPPVAVETIIENLSANSNMAKNILQSLIPTIPDSPSWREHACLNSAILTPREAWPSDRIRDLYPLLGRFLIHGQ